MKSRRTLPSSFRDPSGFLFAEDGRLFRQVNHVYKDNYDLLLGSGLYHDLVDAGLLIPHEETDLAEVDGAYKVLRPEVLPFVSYPYEWSFSQLKDAALTTLRIQKRALDFGMSLKDASVYNVQFRGGKPLLIDTLSFEQYREGEPWVAYRQFCQHFLAPLALMSRKDIRLNQLLRVYIDGVPLGLASRLLPLTTRASFSLLAHIHLHAGAERRFTSKPAIATNRKMDRRSFLALIDNLESAVRGLKWQPKGTQWADYYASTNYTEEATLHKRQLVAEFLDRLTPAPRSAWDLGANTGLFSRVAAEKGIFTVSLDVDPACVERNYLDCKKRAETHILPLLIDLTNPSSSLGWASRERMSLVERGPADVALALALVHHLAIANNLPFAMIADFFASVCRFLIIEFVPKEDSQVQRLLSTREDIFPQYTQAHFELEFGRRFRLLTAARVNQSARVLYLMERQD
ncbi:MAG: hypothetical protein M0Z94_16325 [Dehalococcoidales bacterium]|nr:hypothetical protein [Dehalococcoidales bacterium]